MSGGYPSLFGTGLFGVGLFSRNFPLPWTTPVTVPATGSWDAFHGCAGVGTGLAYGRRAYGRGPWPIIAQPVWQPVGTCSTSNWQPTRLAA